MLIRHKNSEQINADERRLTATTVYPGIYRFRSHTRNVNARKLAPSFISFGKLLPESLGTKLGNIEQTILCLPYKKVSTKLVEY